MSAHQPFEGRTLGPRSGPRVECAHNADQFQVVGLTELSPLFRTCTDAEEWLRAKLPKLPRAKRPQQLACMRCRTEFQSEGFHNRMCGPCRNVAANDDASVFRSIVFGAGEPA